MTTERQAINAVGQNLAKQLDAFCASKNFQTAVLLGVGFESWTAWSRELDYALPKGMGNGHAVGGRANSTPGAIAKI
jgi:hypothetical protein